LNQKSSKALTPWHSGLLACFFDQMPNKTPQAVSHLRVFALLRVLSGMLPDATLRKVIHLMAGNPYG
jgi:hypothetical protein